MILIIYFCNSVIALVSAVLLMRAYHRTRNALLGWSAYCFFGLTATNILVILDKTLFPSVDLFWLRAFVTLISLLLLLYGLIMKSY